MQEQPYYIPDFTAFSVLFDRAARKLPFELRAARIERRVEVDQVDALVGEILAQNGQVVPVEQGLMCDRFLHGGSHHRLPKSEKYYTPQNETALC